MQLPAAGSLKRAGRPPGRLAEALAATKLRSIQDQRERAKERGSRAAKQQRVDYIVEEMLALRWNGEVARMAMLRFNVSSGTIEHDAAEAKRQIERVTTKDAELKTRLELTLQEFRDIALDLARTGNDHVRVKAIGEGVKAIQTWAQLRGVEAPKQDGMTDLASVLGEALGRRAPGGDGAGKPALETTGEETK